MAVSVPERATACRCCRNAQDNWLKIVFRACKSQKFCLQFNSPSSAFLVHIRIMPIVITASLACRRLVGSGGYSRLLVWCWQGSRQASGSGFPLLSGQEVDGSPHLCSAAHRKQRPGSLWRVSLLAGGVSSTGHVETEVARQVDEQQGHTTTPLPLPNTTKDWVLGLGGCFMVLSHRVPHLHAEGVCVVNTAGGPWQLRQALINLLLCGALDLVMNNR